MDVANYCMFDAGLCVQLGCYSVSLIYFNQSCSLFVDLRPFLLFFFPNTGVNVGYGIDLLLGLILIVTYGLWSIRQQDIGELIPYSIKNIKWLFTCGVIF